MAQAPVVVPVLVASCQNPNPLLAREGQYGRLIHFWTFQLSSRIIRDPAACLSKPAESPQAFQLLTGREVAVRPGHDEAQSHIKSEALHLREEKPIFIEGRSPKIPRLGIAEKFFRSPLHRYQLRP